MLLYFYSVWGFFYNSLFRIFTGNLFLLLPLALLLLANPVFAQNIYEWTDENGVKHYSNTEAGVPEQYRKESNSIKFGDNHNIGNSPQNDDFSNTDELINTFVGGGEVYKIPFTPFEGAARRIIIPVTINNDITAQLALDTGSPGMIISQSLAKKLGLYENNSGLLLSVASGIGG